MLNLWLYYNKFIMMGYKIMNLEKILFIYSENYNSLYFLDYNLNRIGGKLKLSIEVLNKIKL